MYALVMTVGTNVTIRRQMEEWEVSSYFVAGTSEVEFALEAHGEYHEHGFLHGNLYTTTAFKERD